jgi:hypothetical protein
VYQDLRAAIARGLHLDNLWAIVRVCTKRLQTNELPNPIVAFTIKAICTHLASSGEGHAVSADHSELVDAHLLPAMERLLDVAYGSAEQICDALNHLAKVHADTLPRS